MEYCNELPKHFKTWIEFYDQVQKSNLLEGYKSVVYFEEKYDQSGRIGKPKEKSFLIQTIKDNVLEELLSERMNKSEVIYWEKGVEAVLREYGHQDQSPLILGLRKVKRILLTQSKK
ncbi:hypothetical protein F132_14 [Flavobacterium sp. phage 1/32]|nr:hypothetical protein F132_14 [Flavobacterium sp. phage 1/32]